MILLIDGDVLAHLACKTRYHKDGLILIDSDGNPLGQLSIDELTPEQDAQYLDESWENFLMLISKIQDEYWGAPCKIAVKHEKNFREDIYPAYKEQRKREPGKMNPFVPLIRQEAVDKGVAVYAENMEADDYLAIWATEAKAAGEEYVICSIDKDLKTIPGRHYNVKSHSEEIISPEYATRFFYTQLLMGDPTDNIKGIPGIGPKKAEAALADYNEEDEFQFVVSSMYQEHFGPKWEEELLLNGKLLYLLRSPTDEFNIEGWLLNDYRSEEAEADDSNSIVSEEAGDSISG